MNIRYVLLFLLVLAVFIDSTIVSFPFVFIISVFLLMLFKKKRVYLFVFLSTLIFDSLSTNPLGVTTVGVFATSFLISMYSRQLHAADIFFLTVFIFIASFVYGNFAGYTLSPLLYISTFIVVLILFFTLYSKRGVISERSL